MFRLLVLCATLTFVKPYTSQCRKYPPFHGDRCPGAIITNLEILMEPIEQIVIEQEEQLVQFCRENSPAKIGQMYKIDNNYYLIYDLIEARNSRITVRIKHIFLHITATDKYDDQEIIFQDVKVLPDMLNTDAAQWTYNNEEKLIIKIPYRVPLGTLSKSCPVVNKYVIDVPHVPESEFNYDLLDWTRNGYNAPSGRPSGTNYGSQDSQGWSQNGYNAPASRPSGPNYGSQDSQGWSQNGYNSPASRPSGPNYGSQDSQGWSQNGYNAPASRPSGPNYGSQDSQGWSQNGYNAPASRPSGPNGPHGWSQNGYNAPPGRPPGPNYPSQSWSQNGYYVPPGRPSGPNYGSQNSIQNGHNVTVDPTSLFDYR